MAIQCSDMDEIVVQAIREGYYTVDSGKGAVWGRKLSDGSRREIGTVAKNCKSKKVVMYFKGRNRGISVARMVWLSVHGSVPGGMRVEPSKEGIYSIGNLNLVSSDEKSTRWIQRDVDFLTRNIDTLSWEEMGKELNRSEKSCRNKARDIKAGKKIKKRAWTEKDDNDVERMLKDGLFVPEIAKRTGRTYSSISLRARKFGGPKKESKHLIRELNSEHFYTALKSARNRGTAVLSCCLCDKDGYKYCIVHHIDGDRSNGHISNQSTLCPNCHSEVHGGEYDGKQLFAIWRRACGDYVGEIETNKEMVKN